MMLLHDEENPSSSSKSKVACPIFEKLFSYSETSMLATLIYFLPFLSSLFLENKDFLISVS